MKIHTNDTVLITVGKYKGKTGKVLKIYKKMKKITVEKINIRTKHIKKTTTKKGERIRYEAPFDASNVKVLCPNCTKAVRIGYEKGKNNKKQRICKKCDKPLDSIYKTSKKSK